MTKAEVIYVLDWTYSLIGSELRGEHPSPAVWVNAQKGLIDCIEAISPLFNKEKTTYLLDAFNLQMIEPDCQVKIEEVFFPPNGLISAIEDENVATILGVKSQHVDLHLEKGDIAYVAKLQGGQLPKGVTELPEGFSFKYYRIEVQ